LDGKGERSCDERGGGGGEKVAAIHGMAPVTNGDLVRSAGPPSNEQMQAQE
jgi:hypothetical protein